MQITGIGFPDSHYLDVLSLPELGDNAVEMVMGNACDSNS